MLPQVAAATALVVLLPVALVWWLRGDGVVSSSWMCVLLAMALSIVVSGIGSAYWKRRQGSELAVFSDLLLWGWLRRVRLERRIATTVERLGDQSSDANATTRGELLRALASALDAQDPYTEGHSRRVARHAAMVARELGLSDDQVQRVSTAAAMHDVGKLSVPPSLLTKPDSLTTDEFEIVKRHATEGAAMVDGLGDAELTGIVRHHHERFDGGGYPSGLRGPDIPLGARIVAVADTFDALTSIRPYRPATQHKQALDHLLLAAGTQLDPVAVRAFLRYYSGRKGSALWAALAVAPQRLFAWMHGNAGAAGNVGFGELAATIGGLMAVGLAAMGTAAAVGVGSHQSARRGLVPGLVPVASSPAPGAGPLSAAGSAPSIVPHRTAAGPGPVGAVAGRANDVGGAPRSSRSATHSHASQLAGNHAPATTAPAQRSGGNGAGLHSGPSAGNPGTRHQRTGGGSGGVGGAGGIPGPGSGRKPAGGGAPAGGSTGTLAAAPTPTAGTPVASAPSSTAVPGGASPGAGPTGMPGTPVTGSGGTSSGAPGGAPSPAPSGPATKDDCKAGGYKQFGFTNQGQCVAAVESHLARPAGDPSRPGAGSATAYAIASSVVMPAPSALARAA